MTSLALTQSGSSPVNLMPKILGILVMKGSPIMARATSRPPVPMANIPIEPAATVWESEPRRVFPGIPKRSM